MNLGLAVDVERQDGSRFLVVPVIKGADDMDFAAFHARYEELVTGARANRLSPDDFAGGTITLTNPGTLGTTASVPRLMAGQGTIVATGAIRSLAGQRLMTITSTYDHRIIQGAESGGFLRRIDDAVAGRDGFYEEVFAAMGAELGPAPVPAPGSLTAAPPVAAAPAEPRAQAPGSAADDLRHLAAAMSLVGAYRLYGHLGATLDPLGGEPPGDPALDPAFHGLTPEIMDRIPAGQLGVHVPGETLGEVLAALRRTYTGTIAYEMEHIGNHEERAWLRRVIESGRAPCTAHRGRAAPAAGSAHRGGGAGALPPPGLPRPEAVQHRGAGCHGAHARPDPGDGAAKGTGAVVIGMAHRGRLNVLAHTWAMSYDAILAEFEAGRPDEAIMPDRTEADDVKYHLGADGVFPCAAGAVSVSVMPNPCHLEAVDPVVEGRARAEQTDRSGPLAAVDTRVTLPILIHGDAAFAAQGVVAETFNLSRLPGYANGGTVHIIGNNQIGFTTGADEARSTTYSSRPGQGLRRAHRPCQRRRSRGLPGRGSPGDALPRRVRRGHGDRPCRLPALRAQRGRRAGLQPAADVREDRRASERPRAVPGAPGGRWRRLRGRSGRGCPGPGPGPRDAAGRRSQAGRRATPRSRHGRAAARHGHGAGDRGRGGTCCAR